jgi:3-isopropylmalate dehydrogenase
VQPELVDASTLKRSVVEGVDLVVVRELTGGIYFGQPSERRNGANGREAVDTMPYHEGEVRRLMRSAFELAGLRRKKVASVDKANVLSTSRLWREVAGEVAREYPDVAFEHVLVDAMAMHLIRRPRDFDVIATENLFGDILTDEAAMLSGSMGLLPSASLGEGKNAAGRPRGLYEPIHGSAPDIAGTDKANPLATILSTALMLRYSLGLEDEAARVERAVGRVLAEGWRTADIAEPAGRMVGCAEMGMRVLAALES